MHVDIELPECHAAGNGIYWMKGELDDEDRYFIHRVAEQIGVVQVFMSRYACQIQKGKVFPWEVVCAAVEDCFQQRFKPHGSLIPAESSPPVEPAHP